MVPCGKHWLRGVNFENVSLGESAHIITYFAPFYLNMINMFGLFMVVAEPRRDILKTFIRKPISINPRELLYLNLRYYIILMDIIIFYPECWDLSTQVRALIFLVQA